MDPGSDAVWICSAPFCKIAICSTGPSHSQKRVTTLRVAIVHKSVSGLKEETLSYIWNCGRVASFLRRQILLRRSRRKVHNMTEVKKINLLLLPGLLNDARLFQFQTRDLSDMTHATVADLTVADTVEELAASVLEHAPPKFALAGLSMGGYVALEIMRQAPERVLGLALLDTSARPDTAEASAMRLKLMEQAETNFQVVLDNLMPKLVHPAHMTYNSIIDSIYSMGHRIGKDAFVRQQRAIMWRIDSRPHLTKISPCPTMVLCGRQDVITPVEVHKELAAAIPGSRLVVVEECGHLSSMGQPKLVSDALRVWLRGIGSSKNSWFHLPRETLTAKGALPGAYPSSIPAPRKIHCVA